MSIIIAVSNKEKDNNAKDNTIKVNSKSHESDLRIQSDKSIINLPKYLSANSNDLEKINIVIDNEEENNNVHSESFNNQNELNIQHEERTRQLDVKDKDGELISANVCASFVSTGSANKKKCHTKISTNQNDMSLTWDKKMSLQTFNDRIIFDEMNIVEADDNKKNMENLNNLSIIMKNKSFNVSSKINKKFSSENLFLYRNILNSKKNLGMKEISSSSDNNCIKLNGNITRNGLNNGFIDDPHNRNNISVDSSKILQLQQSEYNKLKINNESHFGIDNKNLNLNGNNKLNDRIENIKNSIDRHTSTGNVYSSSKNSQSDSSNNSIKSKKNNQVELTCFEKLCGKK